MSKAADGAPARRRRGLIVLWIVLGGLVLLVGVPTIIGFMLPEQYTGHAQADFDKSCEEASKWMMTADGLHDLAAPGVL